MRIAHETHIQSSESEQTELQAVIKSLELAQSQIAHYELLLSEQNQEHQAQIRILCHDLVNPLQIVSMSLESMIENNNSPTIERMKRATDKMEKIILESRRIALQLSKSTPVV